jgi:hypothetical protein
MIPAAALPRPGAPASQDTCVRAVASETSCPNCGSEIGELPGEVLDALRE